jgi:ADP-ribosylglycohydrolase
MNKLPADYRERVYAGWLGKVIGVRLGAPLETWTYQEIADTIGEITGYLPLLPGKIFKPDDDTAVPLLFLRALEDFGPHASAQEMGESLLNYLGDQRGTFWWGGYGVSTEHTAYINLANGIPAPHSGSATLNGKWLSEQIGGQIFSDLWGLLAPNQPQLAADYAVRQASISHDGEGLEGARFIAGLTSMAFGERDPGVLVRSGLALLDPDSVYAKVVRAMLDFHAIAPDDWRGCYRHLATHFGYDKYPGTHIIPNAGVVVLGLLYGQGDFTRSLQITTMCGWDTDCNVGNVGAILGVAVGLAGIDATWREPVNDFLVAASVSGAHNLWRLPECADRISRLGAAIAGEPFPERPRHHFDYPGSTLGFERQTQSGLTPNTALVDLRHDTRHIEGNYGSLKVTLRDLGKKQEVRLPLRTYLHPAALASNYYGASFSPQVYPGQTLTAQVYLPEGAPAQLFVSLYGRDERSRTSHQPPGVELVPGQWTALRYRIPPLHNALLSEVGLVLRTLGEPWRGTLWLGAFDWAGPPAFSTDFSAERPEFGAISQWTFWRGFWRLEGGCYHGSGAQEIESYTGDDQWGDLALKVELTPLSGPHHRINVRVQGARRSYAVGLAEHNRLVLYKKAGTSTELASAPFAWQTGQRYRLSATVTGNQLAVGVEGVPEITFVDQDAPYLRGQIGLSNAGGGHTQYSWVEVAGVE